VELVDGQVVLSSIVFALTSLVMVGLSEIAIAMSDPFGEDQADFNLEAFLAATYDNAVGFLTEDRSLHSYGLPEGMDNPLDEANSHLRRWANDASAGLVDRRATPRQDQMPPPMRNLGVPLGAPPVPAAMPERRGESANAAPDPVRSSFDGASLTDAAPSVADGADVTNGADGAPAAQAGSAVGQGASLPNGLRASQSCPHPDGNSPPRPAPKGGRPQAGGRKPQPGSRSQAGASGAKPKGKPGMSMV
jgi:hypothetical protein